MTRAELDEHKGLPVVRMPTRAAFARWLGKHHGRDQGVWLQLGKKNRPVRSISYEDARELAITWGWIDGQINSLDEDHYLLRFTPRRPRSKWSKINREIAERLLAEGLMQPPGLAEVEAAKADGRWEAAYPGSATITEPEDFLAALAAEPAAPEFYATVSRAARFAILIRIHDAKRADTRRRRIAELVAQLGRGETPV